MSPAKKIRSWRQNTWGELLAEFFGTFILICFGDGVVAVFLVGLSGSGRPDGSWILITWGWAFAVALGVYVAGGVTGAHINPAVTFANALNKVFPWRKVIPYWIAQTVGGFAGAAVVYLDYFQSIDKYNAAHHVASRASSGGLDTFSIFATFPTPAAHGTWFVPFFDQVVGTFFLVVFILAIVDKKNVGVMANMWPFMVGIAVAAIGMSFGTDAGYAINPARDFGPRLFTWFAGWGQNAFPGPSGYWWIPIVGPLVGGGIAPFAYRWFIGKTIEGMDDEEEPKRAED